MAEFLHPLLTVVQTVLMAEPLTTTITVVVLVVRGFGVYFSGSPLRRVRLRLFLNRDDKLRTTNKTVRATVWKVLHRALAQVQNGVAPAPVAVGRQLCRWQHLVDAKPDAAGQPNAHKQPNPEWPFDAPEFVFALEVLRRALEPRSSTLAARYLLADRWTANRTFLLDLHAYLGQFDGLRRAGEAPPLKKDGQTLSFPAAVSAMTGVLVLADATTANAACVEEFAVWHNGAWLGLDPVVLADSFKDAYERADEAAREARVAAKAPTVLATPGQYNGRIPVLRRVEVRQHTGSDGAVFALVTDETDYDTTEGPKRRDGEPPPPESPLQCKHLAPRLRDDHMVRYARATMTDTYEQNGVKTSEDKVLAGAWQARGERTAMVNGKVALVSMSDRGNFLALMQRSGRVSNAQKALAQSSGGVVELGVPGDPRDGDPYGSVDFLGGIRREIQEELGLTPDDYLLEANCVFAANNRPRPRGETVDNGELVTTVLAVGRTPLDKDGFDARAFRASPSKGRYESTGSLFVPMNDGPAAFAEAIMVGRYEPESLTWVDSAGDRRGRVRRALAERWGSPTAGTAGVPVIDNLEQSGLVAAIYASATVFGPGPTVRAFREAMKDQPWWTTPWPVDPDDPVAPGVSLARVCRPPRTLLTDESTFDAWVGGVFDGHTYADFDPAAVP